MGFGNRLKLEIWVGRYDTSHCVYGRTPRQMYVIKMRYLQQLTFSLFFVYSYTRFIIQYKIIMYYKLYA